MDAHSLRELFGPLSGMIAAVVFTIGAALKALLGSLKTYRLPPEGETIPKGTRGVLNVVLFAPFLICFFLMRPELALPALIAALVPMVIAVVCYQKYGGLLRLHRHTKPKDRHFLWFQWNKDEYLLGGTELQPRIAKRKAETGFDDQRLLAETEYKPDEVWTKESRLAVQTNIERWYYGFMLCALLTVVIAALSTQTILSGEAPRASAERIWAKLAARDS
jgi:hypothetical protein